MRLGVLCEDFSTGETRVAIVPEVAKILIKKSHQIYIESDAGLKSSIPNQEYKDVGCEVLADKKSVIDKAECILKTGLPTTEELSMLTSSKSWISQFWALRNKSIVDSFNQKKITSFSLDLIPRISRAQSMDILSSQATVAGYKAVLMAANMLPKFLPMLTTAAGTIRPAQGLILGAGVAGLQAIATSRRLGAITEAFDARAAVKEQVKSLGANFIDLPTEAIQGEAKGGYAKEQSEQTLIQMQNVLAPRVKLADFIITTAQIPGKPAPRLITKAMVQTMKPGSVIIDLAAESGGNCECTVANQTISVGEVKISGPQNLAALLPLDASRMFARNLSTLLLHIVNDKGFTFDWNDEIFLETCATFDGAVKSPRLL